MKLGPRSFSLAESSCDPIPSRGDSHRSRGGPSNPDRPAAPSWWGPQLGKRPRTWVWGHGAQVQEQPCPHNSGGYCLCHVPLSPVRSLLSGRSGLFLKAPRSSRVLSDCFLCLENSGPSWPGSSLPVLQLCHPGAHTLCGGQEEGLGFGGAQVVTVEGSSAPTASPLHLDSGRDWLGSRTCR